MVLTFVGCECLSAGSENAQAEKCISRVQVYSAEIEKCTNTVESYSIHVSVETSISVFLDGSLDGAVHCITAITLLFVW
jgi:hypothetical protein